MSDGQWQAVVDTVGGHVKSYRREGLSFVLLLLGILLAVTVFHPAIGAVGREIANGRRRRLATYRAAVEPDSGVPEKDGTYLTWADYGRACSAGCKYAEATSGACPKHGQLYVQTRYNDTPALDPRHGLSPECRMPCVICHHDPCFAQVRLGGAGRDIERAAWFSCCAAWSRELCTDAQSAQLRKLRCTKDSGGADGCGGRSWEEDDEGESGGAFGWAMLLYICSIFGGVGGFIWWGTTARQRNHRIDQKVDVYLSSLSGPRTNASFSLIRSWTQTCKPKGARTYRALCIAPYHATTTGIAMPAVVTATQTPVTAMPLVEVVVPAGYKEGDTMVVAGTNGQQLSIVVPAGVGPGQAFRVQLPAASPPVVTATVVSVVSAELPSA